MKSKKCKIDYPFLLKVVSIRRIVRTFSEESIHKQHLLRPYSDGQHAPVYPVSTPDSIRFSNLVGRVVDSKGIIGKGLTVKVGSVSKTTDENGIFEIGGLSSGIDSITVSDGTNVLYSTSITLKPGGNTIDIAVMDITTGIQALTEKGLSLYPNPATNILHISGLNEGASVAILDVSGKTVLHHQQVRDAINISSLEKGIYILKIMTNEGIAIERFVKE